MHIVITGGAGYIGSSLVPYLLSSEYEHHQVTVFDNLLHGGDGLLGNLSTPGFTFLKGDIRDRRALKDACRYADVAIHLAALVGAPVCDQDQEVTKAINVEGSVNLEHEMKDRRVIYASSVSVYGKADSLHCTENNQLHPQTSYGVTKAKAENEFMNYNPRNTSLRFGTAYGTSPRMRYDLLINDLVYRSVKEGHATIYQADFVRPFVHVLDICRSINHCLKLDKTEGQIFNVVGENLTKREVCKQIDSRMPTKFHFSEVGEDKDLRNYEVSSEKFKNLGFWYQQRVECSIYGLATAARMSKVHNPYSNI